MTTGLKLALFGLRGAATDPDVMARRAKLAEDVGFEALWVGDHIALPPSYVDPADEPRLEALVALSYLAAVTTRLRLGVGVIVLPQRQPVLLAKQLTSIDVLSKGRLTVGIGVGYVEPELRALGVPLGERGARADEYLAAIHSLWKEPTPSFGGRFVSFSDVVERPLPVQQPHPPIVIGGHSPAAHRRAISAGNGWYGWQLDVDQTAQALTDLRETASRQERPPGLGELEITITPSVTVDIDTARRYADLGVHRLAIQPQRALSATAIEQLITTVGETIIGRV